MMNHSEQALAELLAAGPNMRAGETDSGYLDRVRTVAEGVIRHGDFDAMLASLSAGKAVRVPVDVATPLVDQARLEADRAAHSVEIKAAADARRAIIQGAALAIVGALTAAGSGAITIPPAIMPLLASIRDVLRAIRD